MSLVNRAYEIFKKEGGSALASKSVTFISNNFESTYQRYIRPLLPSTGDYPIYNTVQIGADKHVQHVFDDIVPVDTPSTSNRPQYEEPLVDAIQECVSKNDNVVIIGGGYGVTTVVAARNTEASVTAYEAIDYRTSVIRKTAAINNVADQCTVVNAIIGPAINPGGGLPSEGTTDPASQVDIKGIPSCEVLELDCEGAELEILDNLAIRPRHIIVETHRHRGAPEDEVRSRLSDLGYNVISREVENEETGVYVLTAARGSKILDEDSA